MIKYEARYFNNAHRLSDVPVDAAVTVLYDGQWMQISEDGTAVLSDGAVNKKSYMTISSKWGALGNGIGTPITAEKTGRDNVSSTGTVSLLLGGFRVATDQFDATKTYVPGAALKVYDGTSDEDLNGKLVPCVFVEADDVAKAAANANEALKTVAYVFKAPATAGDALTIVSN